MIKKMKTTRDPACKNQRFLIPPINLLPRNRSGQEEMVGFAIIIIIVSVVLLVLLSFLLRNPSKSAVESYEVESFIISSLQYTSSCANSIEFLSVRDLMAFCEREEKCFDEKDSCGVLEETLRGLIENSWNVEEGSPIKGYKLRINVEGEEKFLFEKGNETANYKGGWEDFSKGGDEYLVSLEIYYA